MAIQLTLNSKAFIELNKNLQKVSKKKPQKKEEKLQITVCKYLRAQYPDAIFSSDVASGMKLPIWIGSKFKSMRSERGLPDLLILESRWNSVSERTYCGLALELKNKRDDVYLKDNTISDSKSMKHVREQEEILKRLTAQGWVADFAFGFDDCKKKIDDYFSLKK